MGEHHPEKQPRPGGAAAPRTSRGFPPPLQGPSARSFQGAEGQGAKNQGAENAFVYPSERPGKRRRRRPRSLHVGTACVVAVVAALYLAPDVTGGVLNRVVEPLTVALPGQSSQRPPAGIEASAVPLGVPPAVEPSTNYRLFDTGNTSQAFIAYDPCRPIHYVVRPDHQPPGGSKLIHEAVAEVSAATGLRFIHDGATSEAPAAQREPYQPELYGERWAPVLIAWVTPEENPEVADDIAGIGGSTALGLLDGPSIYVSGQIQLDGPQLSRMLPFPGGADAARAVVIHELGHLVGLDHVDDPTQLMHAETTSPTQLGAGDRAGLAHLGRGPCVPEL